MPFPPGFGLGSICRSAAVLPLLAFIVSLGVPAAHAAFTERAAEFGLADGDSMSYSAGFVDFDGDADPDFVVNNHWRSAFFFRNEGGTGFVEMPDVFRLDDTDRHDQIWGDLDNDGDPDLYVIHGRNQSNELFWNEGYGVFVDGAGAAGAEDMDGRGREISLVDLNGDHFLDIFIGNDFRTGFARPSVVLLNNGDGTFDRQQNDDPIYRSRLHVAAADYDLDGNVDIVTTNPPYVTGEFYRGNGDSTWTDVTAFAFFGIDSPLLQAQGLTWADYNNDGYLDLFTTSGNRGVWDFADLEGDSLCYYVDNDTGELKTITFTTDADSVTIDAIRADYQPVRCYYGSTGVWLDTYPAKLALADLAGEPPALGQGLQGLFVWSAVGASADTVSFVAGGPPSGLFQVGGSLRADNSGFLSWSTSGMEPPPPLADDNWSNRLYRNDGNQKFSEVTATAFAVNDSTYNSKAAAWGDYDNDGWIDVYVSNGGTVETGNEDNYLYRNNGDGTFTEVAAIEGVQGSARGMSDGAAWADVDGDGFLDLYVDQGAEHPPFGVGPRELFVNTPNGNHWISIRLRGIISNGSGIGARVRVVTPSGVQWQTRLGESDNCFSNDTRLHFGVGPNAVVDTVQVFWPSGRVDLHENVAADQSYFGIEGKPLRATQNAHLIVNRADIFEALPEGTIKEYPIPLDNFGGLASHFITSYEDCEGNPVTWASVDPESSSVFPGGTNPLTLTVDTSGLTGGLQCAFVIFDSNSFLGADTLRVWIDVIDSAVGVEPLSGVPREFQLSPPRPNPSRGEVLLTLSLPGASELDVAVYDLAGRRVAGLLSGLHSAGRHGVSWDGRNASRERVAAGIYLIRAVTGSEQTVRKVVILE